MIGVVSIAKKKAQEQVCPVWYHLEYPSPVPFNTAPLGNLTMCQTGQWKAFRCWVRST